MHDAEQFAAEDKKKKEEIDTRNSVDQIVYQSEKTLSEIGDKISEDEKKELQQKIDACKESLKGDDLSMMKAAQEALEKQFYEVSAKMYQQAGPQGGPDMGGNPGDMGGGAAGGANSGANGADFVDADFQDVTDEDDKK